MNTYSVVLFVHILSVLIATGAATIVTLAAIQMRRAENYGQVARWAMAAKNAAKGFPVAVVGLVGSGIYLVQSAWSWSDPWVIGALVGLGAIIVIGHGVESRRGRALGRALGEALATAGDGPVDGEPARLLEQKIGKATSAAPTLLMLGVAFVMVTKPGTAGTVAALLVALALSAPVGIALFRTETRAGMPVPA
jgi:hypothetical protein